MSFSNSNAITSYLEDIHNINEYYKYILNNVLLDIYNSNNILDSSLISESNRKKHHVKFVRCGDYLQFYFYSKFNFAVDKGLEKANDIKHIYDCKVVTHKEYKPKQIEEKNINRSRFMLHNLIKCNEKHFKTFITLTFEQNLTDIKEANKKFHIWRRNLKRLKPDLMYVCVPEFQKRGAVHYHLMTNIEYNDFKILSREERKIYNKSSGWQVGRDIKGWIYGHNMAKDLREMNVIGYISKYMTKDIDNRLFGKHRFFYSQNLEKPEEYLFNLDDFRDKSHYLLTTELNFNYQELTYLKKYEDSFGNDIVYCEYKGKRL